MFDPADSRKRRGLVAVQALGYQSQERYRRESIPKSGITVKRQKNTEFREL